MAIGVIASITVQDGKQADFEAVFKDLAAQVRANEPGNKLYQLCKSRKDPTSYVVMELYDDEAALKAHSQTAHYKAAGPKLGPVVAGPPDVQFYETV